MKVVLYDTITISPEEMPERPEVWYTMTEKGLSMCFPVELLSRCFATRSRPRKYDAKQGTVLSRPFSTSMTR